MGDQQRQEGSEAEEWTEGEYVESKHALAIKTNTSLKVFVGGLSLSTTEADLVSYFSKFGDLYSCKCIMNTATGRSRGFGFVSFREEKGLAACMGEGVHVIAGKPVEVKKAVYKDKPKGKGRFHSRPHEYNSSGGQASDFGEVPLMEVVYPPTDYDADITSRKIFIGGLAHNVDSASLASYFRKYGDVIDSVVMVDKETERSRGFGFITFASEESAVAAKGGSHLINGKEVEVKSAQPRRPTYSSYPKPHGSHVDREGMHFYNDPTIYGGSYYYGGAPPMYYQGYPYPPGAMYQSFPLAQAMQHMSIGGQEPNGTERTAGETQK